MNSTKIKGSNLENQEKRLWFYVQTNLSLSLSFYIYIYMYIAFVIVYVQEECLVNLGHLLYY